MPRRRTHGANGNGRHPSGRDDPAADGARIVRCAIYTRKSTSEGLDQAFNSLDAQREACEAYIASQKALAWEALPTRYDDGGFTGGNIDRPAVQRLLDDVNRGEVDCVVVYKVDRLSRSLLDFARIIKLFEDHRVHFVSVTQHFNTADSMGRLTLNILLSFAQFEREIIAERTRDKIAAARRRGQWAGGRPILGYDLVPGEHRLTVNPKEAEQVRAIFRMYLEKESVLATAQAAHARGWTTKRWTAANGNIIGGRPFDRPNLRHLLTNVAYLGKVRHRDETHPGQHKPILDLETWEKVQRLLRRNARTAGSFLRNKHGALLKGLLRCKACDAAMVQMVSRKGPKLHRYYVCTAAQKRGYDQCPTGTILAGRLEQEVCDRLRRLAREFSGSRGGGVLCTSGAGATGSTGQRVEGAFGCPYEPRASARAAARVEGANNPDDAKGPTATDRQPGATADGEPARGCDDAIRILADGWGNVPPLEQARLLRFVLETVEYDGRTEKVTLTLTAEAASSLATPTREEAARSNDPTRESMGCINGNGKVSAPRRPTYSAAQNPSCKSSSPSLA